MIIILNGTSSSGKSTIVQALNLLSIKPFLHLGIDKIYSFLPPSYINTGINASQGFGLVYNPGDKQFPVTVKFGPYGTQVRLCSAAMVTAFAQQDLDVVVDEVLLGDQFLIDYAAGLTNYTVYFIGINCELSVLRERELLRQNRAVGLAESQLTTIHAPERFYDLILDSTSTSPFANAQKILDFITNNPDPQGFKRCSKRLLAV
jgi:chloramphenicol 3-O phosphotransferase